MKRIDTWEAALSAYIAQHRDTPFIYGDHDCGVFAAGAVKAMTGVDLIPEFRGKYQNEIGAARALKKLGAGNLEKTVDAKLPQISISRVQRGDIVMMDGNLGVAVGGKAWFTGEEGLVSVPQELWDKAWGVGRGEAG